MAQIRISVVTETYVPDVNGVAISLQHLISSLDPERFLVQIVRTRPRSKYTPAQEEVGCRGITIPMYPDLQLGLPAPRTIRKAWHVFQPDLVYIATEGPLGNSALSLARKWDLPVLSAFHTNFHRYSSYYGLSWIRNATLAWLRRFHNRTLMTLVPTTEVQTMLKQQHFNNVELLPHGVDCQHFHPEYRNPALRSLWGVSAGERVLLYVGRIAAEKNIPLAIKAWQLARQEFPDIRLVMVGDGPMRQEMQLKHPDVIFAGVKTGRELAEYYASADLFVFPSMTETFGLVTLEAMASALPVVAYNMAAAATHVRPGIDGFLAEENDEVGFVKALCAALAMDLTLSGIDARAQAEDASWHAVAERFSGFAEMVIRGKSEYPKVELQSLV
jgi:glycosyltransferase involved in cell wall biosynthesis